MKANPISSQSTSGVISTSANAAGIMTPILTVTVPRGATYDLPNWTKVRGENVRGVALIVDLRNSSGDRIRDGVLLIGSKAPADDFTSPHRTVPLSIWADLSSADQRNENFRVNIASSTDLNVQDVLVLPADYKLEISLKSAEVVDWSRSFFELPFVEENN